MMVPITNYGITHLSFSRCVASGAWVGDCSLGSSLLLLPSLLPAYAANLVFHFSNILSFDSPAKMLTALVVFWFLMGALGSIIVKQFVEFVKRVLSRRVTR